MPGIAASDSIWCSRLLRAARALLKRLRIIPELGTGLTHTAPNSQGADLGALIRAVSNRRFRLALRQAPGMHGWRVVREQTVS
jgi:hypothetical protein